MASFRAGILMLDTRFPRIPGDAGNPSTWPFPVDFETVVGVGDEITVPESQTARFQEPFVEAARRLEDRGVNLITACCESSIFLQDCLQAAVGVPVLTSSLLQVPWIATFLGPHAKIAILTFEQSALSPAHLWAGGINPARVVVGGLEDTAFHEAISGNLEVLDTDRAREEHISATRRLLAEHTDIEAVVLECTNMSPYAPAIREATDIPVYDLTTLIGWAASAHMHD